jgi:hypothetical protein
MSEISFLGVKINFTSGEISVLGYKFRILTLVLIYVLYLIIFGNLLCSCTTMSLGDMQEYFAVASIPEGFQDPKPKPKPIASPPN